LQAKHQINSAKKKEKRKGTAAYTKGTMKPIELTGESYVIYPGCGNRSAIVILASPHHLLLHPGCAQRPNMAGNYLSADHKRPDMVFSRGSTAA
jgi:hypothetical protein